MSQATASIDPSPVPSGSLCMLAGIVAGCVTRSCTSPLDVLKILFQLKPRTSYPTIYSMCTELYSKKGIRGFWQGNLAGCCRLGPYAGTKFFIFDKLTGSLEDPSHGQCALHGSCAGMIATVVAFPMEVVRTRIIQQTFSQREFDGIVQGLCLLVKHEGIRGLYRGVLPGLVGSIPFEGTQFACYESAKAYMQHHRWPAWRWEGSKEHLDPADHLAIGSVSGAVAQMVAYPFDTIKKRLQAQNLGHVADKRYDGMLDCAVKMWQNEGLSGLYRGSVPNLVRVAPHTAIMFTTYEFSKEYFLTTQSTYFPSKPYDERTHRHID